jgi:hypothetical protein
MIATAIDHKKLMRVNSLSNKMNKKNQVVKKK